MNCTALSCAHLSSKGAQPQNRGDNRAADRGKSDKQTDQRRRLREAGHARPQVHFPRPDRTARYNASKSCICAAAQRNVEAGPVRLRCSSSNAETTGRLANVLWRSALGTILSSGRQLLQADLLSSVEFLSHGHDGLAGDRGAGTSSSREKLLHCRSARG